MKVPILSEEGSHIDAWYTPGEVGTITVTTAACMRLSQWELEALIAHEIGHYKLDHVKQLAIFSCVSLPVLLLTPPVFGLEMGLILQAITIAVFAILRLGIEEEADDYAILRTSRQALLSVLQAIDSERHWHWELKWRIARLRRG